MMRRTLVSALNVSAMTAALFLSTAVLADAPLEESAVEPSDREILQAVADDASAPAVVALEDPTPSTTRTSPGIVLGPRGVDAQGRAGRLHTVSPRDTLWDLAAAYLGTPWVWPSVWIDNDDIDNPHLILPGDKIWITANEMRVVSNAEAESFLAPAVPAAESMDPESFDPAPVAALEGSDEPSTLEAFPVTIPGSAGPDPAAGRSITVVRRDSTGFISARQFEAASTIVDSPVERTYLTAGDDVILGVGEGDVEIGDQFIAFEAVEEVRDPESRRLLGHHIERLAWVEVKALTGDTSIAEIRMSYAELRRGVSIMPRVPMPLTVDLLSTPDAVEGKVVFLPSQQTVTADGDYVYINRGELHGVEVGSELEIFASGTIMTDPARRTDVRTPDHVFARLAVVSVEPESAVAFVIWSDRELAVGDTVRPTLHTLAQR